MNVRRFHFPVVVALLAVALVACGKDLQPSPTGVPTVSNEASPTGLTAGDLADRIAAGWKTVERYRAETNTYVQGTPEAMTESSSTIEEVILPDQRRQVVSAGGVVQSEIVAANGNIYGRGPGLPGINQPNRDPNAWITINGNVLGPDNPFSSFYQSLLLPVQPPYAGLSETVRKRPVEERGIEEIGGRDCQQYRIIDTTLAGDRVEIVLSLSADDLVCAIETTSDSSVTLTTYSYDQPAEIEIPASPVPAPAENG